MTTIAEIDAAVSQLRTNGLGLVALAMHPDNVPAFAESLRNVGLLLDQHSRLPVQRLLVRNYRGRWPVVGQVVGVVYASESETPGVWRDLSASELATYEYVACAADTGLFSRLREAGE